MSQPQQGNKFTRGIIKFCFWLTDAVGSVPAFIFVVVWLVGLYIFLPIVGYARWNSGIGLFGNTNGSNVELITGIGSMVMLNVLHKQHKKAKESQNTPEHHGELLRAHGDMLHAQGDALVRIENYLGIKKGVQK